MILTINAKPYAQYAQSATMVDEEGGENGPLAGADTLNHILSHDLTNFLNIIQGHTDMLLSEMEDTEAEEHLLAIKRQAIAATAMLQTVGGSVRGGAQASFDTVNIGDLVSNEADRLQAAYPGATISTDIDEETHAQVDELFLSVIANLLENAIKHNDSATPTVKVTVTTLDRVTSITVEDDGPGMPEEIQDQLLGLTLAPPQSGVHIIRFLVEKYGGTIWVDASHKGTKIAVKLPNEQE